MKKKLLLTTFLFSIVTVLLGQNFGSVGTQWYYSEHAGGAAPPNSEYLHLQSVSDTVISGMTTHKIVRTYYKYNGGTEEYGPLYVYEKSDTAFMYNFQKAKFQTIYIFNALQGDTITLDYPEQYQWTTDTTYRLVIDTVETVLFEGASLKRYRTIALDEFQFYNNGYFMDRIGGLDWFFPRPAIIPEAGGPIRCYSDNQIDTSFQTVACDYRLISSVNKINNEIKVNVFPNPIIDVLTIQTELAVDRIELTDLTGKRLVTTNQLNMDCKNISKGIYLLTIYSKEGQRINRKVIKNAL